MQYLFHFLSWLITDEHHLIQLYAGQSWPQVCLRLSLSSNTYKKFKKERTDNNLISPRGGGGGGGGSRMKGARMLVVSLFRFWSHLRCTW